MSQYEFHYYLVLATKFYSYLNWLNTEWSNLIQKLYDTIIYNNDCTRLSIYYVPTAEVCWSCKRFNCEHKVRILQTRWNQKIRKYFFTKRMFRWWYYWWILVRTIVLSILTCTNTFAMLNKDFFWIVLSNTKINHRRWIFSNLNSILCDNGGKWAITYRRGWRT